MPPGRSIQIRELLLTNGPLSALELASRLHVSQPTISRSLKTMSREIVAMGRGRSSRYALRREILSLGSEIPLFTITSSGKALHVAQLIALQPRGFFLQSRSPSHYVSRYYEDLPWWLTDVRPSGFLGRLIPRKFPEFNFPEDIRLWSDSNCLLFWTMLGDDLIGDLVVGETALSLIERRQSSDAIKHNDRTDRYEEYASSILALSHVGSSAAGEQPKFLVSRLPGPTPVLVKFSPAVSTSLGKRRAELLICEHLALSTLAEHGVPSAKTEVILGEKRVFLEVERFDRVSRDGRRGIVSLGTLDAEFAASSGDWRSIARALERAKILTESLAQEVIWRYYFGLCIANSDMHAGNVSFYLTGEHIQGLAPVYDMLPMALAPLHEDLPSLAFTAPTLPINDQSTWQGVIPVAIDFWNKVLASSDIGAEVKALAQSYLAFLRKHLRK